MNINPLLLIISTFRDQNSSIIQNNQKKEIENC